MKMKTSSMKTIKVTSVIIIIGLALLSGILVYQYQNLKAAYDKLTLEYESLSREHKSLQISYASLQGNYTTLSKKFSDLQQSYSSLNQSFTILSINYTSLKEIYREAVNRISELSSQVLSLQTQLLSVQNQLSSLQISYTNLQSNYTSLLTSYTLLQGAYNVLNTNYADALKTISNLQSQIQTLQTSSSTLQNQYNTLKSQYDTLQAQYNALQTQYNNLLAQYTTTSSTNIYIGTTLESYYQYVRLNYLTVTGSAMDEARWINYPNYYSTSVKFAAALASHDIGNSYWTELESGCDYYNYAGEYSYQTSSRIMQRTTTLAGISSSDSYVTKIQKVLAYIHSTVHYEDRVLDHMWFPTETLTFHSGDCTGFSILASAMFEMIGIKSAVAFFTNTTLGAHAMVMVHVDSLGGYGYWYYSDLTGYGLASGKWIIIEPQCTSLENQQSNMQWIGYWRIVACAEVPYGP